MAKLYVWKRPVAVVSNLDHTMVTDYPVLSDSSIPVINYWYCWGDAHKDGTNFKSADADIDFAKCISTPNITPDDHAGIPGPYGIHGVCQQVANRILYATQSDSGRPITVEGARGYKYSQLLYGAYGSGTPSWEFRLSNCVGAIEMPNNDDRLAVFAPLSNELSSEQMDYVSTIHNELLLEKEKLDEKVLNEEISGEEFAYQVNQLMETKMREIADYIGEEAYYSVFNQMPNEPSAVMDPEIAKKENYAAAKPNASS